MADPTGSANGDISELKEDYQQTLFKFLQQVPALEGLQGPEIESGTPHLKSEPNNPITQARIDALGAIKTNPLFKKYTGWEHKALLQKWINDRTTTCNEFISKCVAAMGYTGKVGIGRFDIADQLAQLGLSHLWVPADSGAIPEYGDAYRLLGDMPDHNKTRLNHMGISLFVKGKDWYTVDSGQSGPSAGHDSLRRNKRDWKPTYLRGWVSMKALLNAEKPLPFWLGGWWQVQESGNDKPYYYYFGASGKVIFTPTAPTSVVVPAVSASMIGNFVSKSMFTVEITWQGADGKERLTIFSDPKHRKYVIKGDTDLKTTLKGDRMMLKNAAD